MVFDTRSTFSYKMWIEKREYAPKSILLPHTYSYILKSVLNISPTPIFCWKQDFYNSYLYKPPFVLRPFFSIEKTRLQFTEIQTLTKTTETALQLRMNRHSIHAQLNGDLAQIDARLMLNQKTTAHGVDIYTVAFNCYSLVF